MRLEIGNNVKIIAGTFHNCVGAITKTDIESSTTCNGCLVSIKSGLKEVFVPNPYLVALNDEQWSLIKNNNWYGKANERLHKESKVKHMLDLIASDFDKLDFSLNQSQYKQISEIFKNRSDLYD